ncbi:sec-independent translocase [Brooklawnia cerclae]|uniref:Sec-independent protein translocase protein TatB n=1 Tax=Brooklawnia cerclae TaxID=349934 RepID=A0ABX0SGX5_9ACTN|nr:sec-independent translocase [Brooklawnia cerclae]NIH57648.1 sec-independent protein translocase protein TatB [Brooklawnia cerclae]
MEIFGIGSAEFVLLLVLAVIMFGPEKLPEVSRRAARIVHFVRAFANQATNQLKDELGPEYKDLKPSDLNPKTLVSKLLLADVENDLNDIKRELDGVKADLNGSAADVGQARSEVKTIVGSTTQSQATGSEPAAPATVTPLVAWDSEAT